MLRIGKNPKDSGENEVSTEKQDAPYVTPKPFSPYQGTTAETRPQPESNTAAPRAMTENETITREFKDGNLSGFVGSGTVVTGEANFKALMRVDGHLSGRISSTSGTLIVGANGKVDANIEVAVATIQGTVNGDIIASQRLEIGRAGKVNGNIQTPSLVIEQGAQFEGSCKMVKMSADANKSKSNGRDVQPLDTTSMKPVKVDADSASKSVADVSSIAS
ncbi:MAG TPA: polymer-forming cytoskeletal protein [Pyrinomonadaceae bacterium]|nr:polymer-forming cytoskeletal protein [Pyrinomonadaceae bacterium]